MLNSCIASSISELAVYEIKGSDYLLSLCIVWKKMISQC